MLVAASALWWLAGEQWQQQRALEQQCDANRALAPVQIFYTAQTAVEAETLSKALKKHCINIELAAVEGSNDVANILHLPDEKLRSTITDIFAHALYDLPLLTGERMDIPRIILATPLLSGQVFTDNFDALSVKKAGKNEGDLTEGTITQTSDLAQPVTLPDTGEAAIVPELISLAAGTFLMGSQEGGSDELPVHEVVIAAFDLGKNEVTWAEWQRCERAGSCETLECPVWLQPAEEPAAQMHPVVNVSWDQAQAYIDWLNQVTGGNYRLPSEAEWEYATRAGSTTAFSTGECITEAQANFDSTISYGKCETSESYPRQTLPVGSYPPNPWGFSDVHGNVWEWAQDCWNDSYNGAPSDGSAWLAGDCALRVLRGGGWNIRPVGLRSAFRYGFDRVDGDFGVGFRLARTP